MPDAALVSESEIRTFRREGVLKLDFVKVIGQELYQGLCRACAEVERGAAHPAGRDPPGRRGFAWQVS